MACSGGGRQGLKEAQEYPEDFDGYAVGHPPWLLSHLHPWVVYIGNANLDPKSDTYISPELISKLNGRVQTICDSQDGVTDGIIISPWTCDFNSSQLLCEDNNNTQSSCLAEAQLSTWDLLYNNWVDSTTNLISPPLMLGADVSALTGSHVPSGFGTQYVENFVMNNTKWNFSEISPWTVQLADSINPGNSNAARYDLSALRSANAKIIHYHGLADPLIPPAFSIYYNEQVAKTMYPDDATALQDFYRLFLVPGMYHCRESAGAPWYFAGGGQQVVGANNSVPGYSDSQHDILLAVMDWVENGTAPNSIIATKYHNDTVSQGVYKQMPLCPYPQQAQYIGNDVNDATSWVCSNGTSMNLPEMAIEPQGSIALKGSTTTSTAVMHSIPSYLTLSISLLLVFSVIVF